MTDTEDESPTADPRPDDTGLLSQIVRTAATAAKEILEAFPNVASSSRSQGDDDDAGVENTNPSDDGTDDD
ncbi:MAG: hypothetical protein P8L46_03870 [Acidimicrobiales bacterium]|jgi:hypothetical protein|nr:hypothetical protein [Acidimicrobiales bacterium]MDG2217159.1 hypothetical protein [Acidimicrobiales bacterium]